MSIDIESLVYQRERFFFPEDEGAVGDGATDDTAAIQAAIDKALEVNGIVVLSSNKTYLVNSAPRTDRDGHCILSITDPDAVMDTVASSKPIAIVSSYSFISPWSADQAVIKTTRTGDAYSGTYGPPSILGGATDENGRGEFQWTGTVTIKGIKFELPEDPDIAAVDALSWGGCDLQINVVAGDGSSASTVPTSPHAFGIRNPSSYGFGNTKIEADVHQMYTGMMVYASDHIRFEKLSAYKCNVTLGIEDPYPGGWQPTAIGGYVLQQRSPYGIAGVDYTTGVTDPTLAGTKNPHFANFLLNTENGAGIEPAAFNFVNAVKDGNNILRGRIQCHYVSFAGVGLFVSGVVGGTDLRLEIISGNFPGNLPAAATLTLRAGRYVQVIGGTTTITSITPFLTERPVVLIFASTAQVTDGGNLKLAGNFTGGADRTLTLVCDGTDWYEVSRSTN